MMLIQMLKVHGLVLVKRRKLKRKKLLRKKIQVDHSMVYGFIFSQLMVKGSAEDKKKEFVDFLQAVEMEDFNLCVLTQKNLNNGIYSTGFLHPTKERGVLYYQGLVKDMVKKHWELEKAAGKEINPAYVGGKAVSAEAAELEALCNEIECQSNKSGKKLDW
ncbi:unnamed protein product [[Candida] boidinii]|uniref:Unnamed protein product n=1 Tax=Candida boidinii TaxID=5477 RepID=A0ACB5TKJ8_CANBO|nr:unnamed protein product [[Candida] boidinii]